MRELLYLSDAKLRQFQPERGPRLRVREIGVPGIGQVGVDQPAGAHLDAPGDRRLVLHGSPHHLVGGALPDVPRPDLFASHGPLFARAVSRLLAQERDGRGGLHALLDDVAEAFTSDLLTAVHGYARVTMTSDSGLVVASPLYVAFAGQ